MFRTILTYGLIAGVVVAVPMFLMGTLMADNPPSGAIGMAIGYLTMLIAFSTIFVAIKRRRDIDLGGVIRFGSALGMGLTIALIGSVIYVLTWELVLAVNGGDFIANMSAKMLEERRLAGATAPELAEFKAQMDQMAELYTNSLFRFAITFSEVFPVGLLVSLISAALLRNPRFMPLTRSATS